MHSPSVGVLIIYAVVLSLLIPLSAGLTIWVMWVSKDRLKTWAHVVVVLVGMESMITGVHSAAHSRYGLAVIGFTVQVGLALLVRGVVRGRVLAFALQYPPGEEPPSLGRSRTGV